MGKYTRRQFITSAGVGMAAVAGLGLAGCAPQTPADKAMANTGNGGTTFADTIAWDGEYDVVVIGFGGAGAVSACYAADAGAKVLLIDKAPQGMEGGNTRFCGQIILNSDDKEAMLAYNKAMAGDFAVDDELMDAYAEGLTQTKTMLRDFFGVPEENFLDWKEDSSAQPMIAMFVPEYPELEGGDALHVLTVSDNVCNSALWKTYRNKVMSMSDNIDVWYMSPATKLFQDPVSRAVIGVEIDKAGETVNIRQDVQRPAQPLRQRHRRGQRRRALPARGRVQPPRTRAEQRRLGEREAPAQHLHGVGRRPERGHCRVPRHPGRL